MYFFRRKGPRKLKCTCFFSFSTIVQQQKCKKKTHFKKLILSSQEVLTSFEQQWNLYSHATLNMNPICDYLNRILSRLKKSLQPSPSSSQLPFMSIDQLSFYLWKEQCLMKLKTEHQNVFMNCVLEKFENERNGCEKATVRQTLKNVLSSLSKLFFINRNFLYSHLTKKIKSSSQSIYRQS